MSDLQLSTFEQLKATLESTKDADLLASIQQQEGGAGAVLDQVFAGMSEAFDAGKAGGQSAAVQYDLTAPDGQHLYAMRIADGACKIERGTVEGPRVTLRMGLIDFLKLVVGKLNGMQAFMSGKLKVSGDLFFAQTFQSWFNRPS